MKRVVLLLGLLPAAMSLGACGAGEVMVQAQLPGDSANAEPTSLSDLEVWLLPYDRDVIFDSLASAYPEPQPPIPDSLLALQRAVAAANEAYMSTEAQWLDLRARLNAINDSLAGLERSSAEYIVLYREWTQLSPEEPTLGQRSKAMFDRFIELQEQFLGLSQELKARRAQWANQAFEPVDSIIAVRLDALGLEEHADTTGAAGIARFVDVPPGEWWVHARYRLPYRELYWNERIQVEGGEPLRIRLTPEDAEKRPVL